MYAPLYNNNYLMTIHVLQKILNSDELPQLTSTSKPLKDLEINEVETLMFKDYSECRGFWTEKKISGKVLGRIAEGSVKLESYKIKLEDPIIENLKLDLIEYYNKGVPLQDLVLKQVSESNYY